MTRIISGIALALCVAALILFTSSPYFFIATEIFILIALVEYFRMMLAGKIEVIVLPALLLGSTLAAMVYMGSAEQMLAMVIVTLLSIMILSVLRSDYPFDAAAYTLFGVFYVSLTLITLPLIRDSQEGILLLMTLVTANSFGDIFAFYTGKNFGKRKLAPAISPNKTVEGFAGGVVGAMLVALVAGLTIAETLPLIDFIVLGLITGLIGPMGDLTESAIKRTCDVKDSSNLIPGHGGFLDRVDSLMFSAPAFFLYMLMSS